MKITKIFFGQILTPAFYIDGKYYGAGEKEFQLLIQTLKQENVHYSLEEVVTFDGELIDQMLRGIKPPSKYP